MLRGFTLLARSPLANLKDFVGREGIQHFDDRFEPLEQFGIALPEFVKLSGLFLEYVKDRIGAVTTIELGS